MDAEQVSTVSRLVITQSRPQTGGVAEEGPSQPNSGSAINLSVSSEDRVTLSSRNQRASSAESNFNGARRQFDVTEDNRVVLRVLDNSTNEVIRQIPNEEEVRLRQAIQNVLEQQS